METQFNKGIETQGKSEIEVNLDMGNSIRLKKKKKTAKSVESITHTIEDAEDGIPRLKIK